jgi:hypothetical protein
MWFARQRRMSAPLARSEPPGNEVWIESLEPRLLLSGLAAPAAALSSLNYAIYDVATGGVYYPSEAGKPGDPGTRPLGSSAPVGLTPSQIRTAYGIDQILSGSIHGDGTGQTIAIVDAYDNPSFVSSTDPGFANSDLHKFDLQFGIADPPSFRKLDQTGGTSYPPPDSDWGTEIALDVEWAHAIAPKANIVLIEADSEDDSDLISVAVDTARKLSGVSVVTMSFGRDEWDTDPSLNTYFTTPSGHAGVTFLASTGDGGAPGSYPAYSPNVVAVGGTSLTLSGGAYGSETGWSASGGGQSLYQTEPTYQYGAQTSGWRQTPDVAFDADPNSGVAVYDSYGSGSASPWIQVGGTSLSSPCWAGLVAIADQFRALSSLTALDGLTQTLPTLYQLAASNYHDITSGSNGGYAAGPGYDMVTGLGSPVANLLVPLLAAGPSMVVTTTTPAGGAVLNTKPTDFVINFSDPYLATSVQTTDLHVNGQTPYSFVKTDADTVTFHYLTSPVSVQGAQTMTIAAGAILRASDSRGILAWASSFRYDTTLMAVTSTVPANGTTVTLPMGSLQVTFNEAVGASSIDVGNVALSQGSVVSATLVNSTTVAYTLSGVSSEGTLTVTLPAGALTDAYGNPCAAYSGSFSLDIGTIPYPVPFMPVASGGSLTYSASVAANVGYGSDTDTFTLSLNAGQTITALVVPAAGLRPSVQVKGPGGTVLGTATATAAGKDALLETVAVATTGTYSVTVSSTSVTTGQYTLQVTLNAALESESYGGAANGTRATSQSIDGSFITLSSGVTRGGVLGAADPAPGVLSTESEPNNSTAQADQAYANFTSYSGNQYQMGIRGTISTGTDVDWFKLGSMDVGDVLTVSESGTASSRGTLTDPYLELYRYNSGTPTLITSDDDGGVSPDSLIYQFSIGTADTYYIVAESYGGATGAYDLGLWLENTATAPTTGGTLTTETESNNTAATANNASTSWRAVQYLSQTGGTITTGDVDYFAYQFTAGDLVSTDVVSTSGLYPQSWLLNSSGSTLALEDGTSAYTGASSPIYSYRIPTTGTYYLEVGSYIDTGSYTARAYLSTATPPPVPSANLDYYSVTLAAGDVVSLALAALGSGTIHLGLENSGGTTVASGTTGPTNLTEAISSFTVSAAGIYYARVSGSQAVPYSLVLTRNVALDTEPNDTSGTAQTITIATGQTTALVLGNVEPGPAGVEPDNYAVGTALTGVVPGITLSTVGDPGPVTADQSPFTSTGSQVFGNSGGYYWSDTVFLRADFATPVSSVSLDLVPDDNYDPGFLKAYNSAGTLLQDLETLQPPYPGFLTMTITRSTADIAYVVAGAQNGQMILFDHLVAGGGNSGNDYYAIQGRAGSALTLATTTPGDGANQALNTLDPKIELYDPSGTLVASDDNSGPDGRNARLTCTLAATGRYVVHVLGVNKTAGDYMLSATVNAHVAGRYIFYNNSYFDGNNPAANAADDVAIASDKQALLPGGTASFANYTSYSRGINGIMVDIGGLAAAVTAADFTFKVGNSNTPGSWGSAATPASVTVRSGAGVGGSDRVTILWADNAIQNTWLQITVLSDTATGLAANDVFYFGNAVGETGNSTTDAVVDGSDFSGVRDHPRNFLNRSPVTYAYDINRDSFVDGTDLVLARDNTTTVLNALKLITVPGGTGSSPSEASIASPAADAGAPSISALGPSEAAVGVSHASATIVIELPLAGVNTGGLPLVGISGGERSAPAIGAALGNERAAQPVIGQAAAGGMAVYLSSPIPAALVGVVYPRTPETGQLPAMMRLAWSMPAPGGPALDGDAAGVSVLGLSDVLAPAMPADVLDGGIHR